MDINIKASQLADELGAELDTVHLVVGISKERFDAVLTGNGSDDDTNKCTNFFKDRKSAFEKYSDSQKDAIREFERLIIAEGGQNKASQKVGIGAAIMSSLRKGKYSGDNDNIFAKLEAYFEIKQEQKDMPSIFTPVEYAPTSISQMIYERLRNVHRRYDIGGDLWSECVCRAQEYKHRLRRNDLTISEKRAIIKEIKESYNVDGTWKWREKK